MEQITLDIIPSGVRENAYASQYDIGRTIRFNLKSGGATYTLTGAETVTMRVRKPDNTERTESITNTSSTYVDWTTVNGTCDLDGLYDCELVVMNGSVKIGSANFTLNVEIDPISGKAVVLMATGNPVHFNTDLGGVLVDCECELPYKADGYTSATVINSATSPVLDKVPYLNRPLPENAGTRLLDTIVGGTVAFNQLIQNGNFESTTDWSAQNATINGASNNELDVSYLGNGQYQQNIIYNLGFTPDVSHVYFTTIDVKLPSSSGEIGLLGGSQTNLISTTASTEWQTLSAVFKGNTYQYFIIRNRTSSVELNNMKIRNVMFIDLTVLFGSSTIADYVYTLESGTAGAGVTWLKTHGFIAKDYYDYNVGTLVSVKPTKHIEVGKNQVNVDNAEIGTAWNGASNSARARLVIPCFPNTNYVLTMNGTMTVDGVYFGESKTIPPSGIGAVTFPKIFTTASTSKYITLGFNKTSIAKSDIEALKLQLEFGTATDFEPYTNHEYTLDTPDLYGLFKIDASNNLYCDGNTYKSSGEVVLYYEQRAYQSGDESLPDAITDGTNTVVKLATPSSTTADTFTNPQVCENGGSEEYTDTREYPVPVGHDTVYGTDMTVNEVEFGVTVYGGSVDFTTGELISDKNPDGTDKSPADEYSLTPIFVPVREGDNYIITDADGTNTVEYFKKG